MARERKGIGREGTEKKKKKEKDEGKRKRSRRNVPSLAMMICSSVLSPYLVAVIV